MPCCNTLSDATSSTRCEHREKGRRRCRSRGADAESETGAVQIGGSAERDSLVCSPTDVSFSRIESRTEVTCGERQVTPRKDIRAPESRIAHKPKQKEQKPNKQSTCRARQSSTREKWAETRRQNAAPTTPILRGPARAKHRSNPRSRSMIKRSFWASCTTSIDHHPRERSQLVSGAPRDACWNKRHTQTEQRSCNYWRVWNLDGALDQDRHAWDVGREGPAHGLGS
eukprot:1259878-Rhodomonas_salina.3